MQISRIQISIGSAMEATAVPDVVATRASRILTKYLAIPRPASAGLLSYVAFVREFLQCIGSAFSLGAAAAPGRFPNYEILCFCAREQPGLKHGHKSW
jgi:hypothetical protein